MWCVLLIEMSLFKKIVPCRDSRHDFSSFFLRRSLQGANRMLHEEFAEFFNRKYPSVIPDRAAFVAQMAEMYNRQLDLTLGSLAAGLANFEVCSEKCGLLSELRV